MRVTLSELHAMAPEGQAERIREMSAATDKAPNGEVKNLEAQIQAFEAKYKMDSNTMRKQVTEGTLEETLEICQWLMRLKQRDRLAALTARPH